jgi:hypothetical protein
LFFDGIQFGVPSPAIVDRRCEHGGSLRLIISLRVRMPLYPTSIHFNNIAHI